MPYLFSNMTPELGGHRLQTTEEPGGDDAPFDAQRGVRRSEFIMSTPGMARPLQ
jgi:hypothetical protein